MTHLRYALPLAFAVAIGPFALDTYLPSFPALAEQLSVSIHDISLSVAVYIAALSLSQLIGGPFSDRFGRQIIMITGLSIFILSSFLISLVSDFKTLIILRALQAFGGGWVLVCVYAIVRDQTHGRESAKLLSMIGLIAMAAPAIAPAVGGFILALWGWPSIFVALALYGIVVLIALKFTLFKSQPIIKNIHSDIEQEPFNIKNIFGRYKIVFQTRPALRFIFIQGTAFSVMMLFISHASFIYQEHFGVSTTSFSIFFALNIFTMWLVMWTNRLLLNYLPSFIILRMAICLQFISLACLLFVSVSIDNVWFFLPAVMLSIGANGATSPNCMACYMEYFGKNSGSASAVIGASQYGLAGFIVWLVGFLPEHLLSVVIAQIVCSGIALCLVFMPREKVSA